MNVLGLIDLPGWLVGILMLVGTIVLYTCHKRRYFSRLGITTKPSTFLIGDIPLVVKRGFGYLDVDMANKYGKVFGVFMGNVPSLVISDTDIMREILVRDFSKFTDRVMAIPVAKTWYDAVSLAPGAHWKFLRNTLSPTFSSGKMRGMSPYINKCLSTLHEILDENVTANPKGFDIVPILQGYTMDVICSTGFGIEVDSQRNPDNPFTKHSKELTEFKPGTNILFLLGILFPDLGPIWGKICPIDIASKACWEFFNNTVTSMLADRKSSSTKHKDLLQLMINSGAAQTHDVREAGDSEGSSLTVEDFKKREVQPKSGTYFLYTLLKKGIFLPNEGLTDVEMLINSMVFMSAGYDTTATTLSWLVYELALNTDVQDTLSDEIDSELGEQQPNYDNVFKMRYLDMVVQETLRLHPPAGRLNRLASEDTEICGLKIKKGMDCTFSADIMHFLPEYWPNPYKFDAERFAPENKANINEYAYMPFGIGPRNCIGKRLALLEVKMSIVSVLQKYRMFRTDTLTVPMPNSVGSLKKPDKPVILKLVKRTYAA